ncbi:MAG: lysozyme, partial [Cyanobacteria bacterium P01_A01_bin.114]
EGLRLDAYLDPVGVPTIGWGTTRYPDGKSVQLGDTLTPEQAEQYLRYDLAQAQAAVKHTIKTPLKVAELQALTSFTYNVGAEALKTSTLAHKLNQGDRKGAIAEFDRWVHGESRVLPGLVKRRAQEKKLFTKD